MTTEPGTIVKAVIEGETVLLAVWGFDCIDCGGEFHVGDCCDTCGGTNRIPLYVMEKDADRFTAEVPAVEDGSE